MQCNVIDLWESLSEFDHHKPGNVSQNSDFTARKILSKKTKKAHKAEFKPAAGLMEGGY